MSLLNRDWIMTQLNYSDVEQDNVDFCIDWVQSRAESYIGRKLESDTYTWYLNGSGGSRIILPVCPVASITGIYLDSGRDFVTALDEDDYYLDADTGIVDLYEYSAPSGVRTVKVVASAGYTADTLPGDLKMAFVSAISHHMLKLKDRAFGLNSMTAPDGVSASFELELPSDTKRIFDSYREARI